MAPSKPIPRHLQITDLERILWRARNHGKLARIARSLGVSRQAVRQVFWGHRTSARISRAIDARLGQTWRVA